MNTWIINTLKNEYGVEITASYYCPHLPSSDPAAIVEEYRIDCNCRKPNLELFEQAISDYDIDPVQSFAIGDKLRDLSICERQVEGGNCKGFLVGRKEKDDTIEMVKAGKIKGVSYTESLYTAATEIIKMDRTPIKLPSASILPPPTM